MYLSNLHQVIVNGTTQGCRLFELLEGAETSDEIKDLNIELSALQSCFRVVNDFPDPPAFRRISFEKHSCEFDGIPVQGYYYNMWS